MELIRGRINLRPRHRGCVATIGNFDGVHLGHQAVLRELIARGREFDVPTTVVTFEPQPLEFFAADRAPPRLSQLRGKLDMLAKLGIDRVLCLPFDRRLASMLAEEFIATVLVSGLGIRHLIIGDDFRFGAGGHGNFEQLLDAGRRYGYTATEMPTFLLDGERVSSTRIRAALEADDLLAAERLLGRPYAIFGAVRHGDKRGRTIGFPTANIDTWHKVVPVRGVYAVQVAGVAAGLWPGVANIGQRPTFGANEARLEVHLFDFNRDIYRRQLRVDFRAKLRDERRFDSVDALKAQITADCAAAHHVLDELQDQLSQLPGAG
jgi:riboflavin kinase/FMN adenylyltransferase